MLELILGLVLCGTMYKIADLMKHSAWLWFAVTVGIVFVSLLIPWPFLRIFVAGVAALLLIMVVDIMNPADK